jgi:hypothetical protein
MKKVCSWCNIEMGIVPSEEFSEDAITHSICADCFEKIFGPQKYNLMDYLDSLDAPVIVIDSTVCVMSTNRQARTLLKKEMADIKGMRGGDVLECAFAKLPGGCGNTVHCEACTIRNTVMDTFQTGKSHLKTPAYLLQGIPDNYQEIQFEISTEKVKDVVLLRIDNVVINCMPSQ